MLRVAAYCRVSTDQSDQANSYVSQKRYFAQWIARNPDWVLQRIYADEGLSGTSTKKRTQFNAMLEAARRGELDLILTKEVSRFARNTLDALAYTRELRRYGVGVYFLIDNINTLEQEGELRLTIMSSIAQEESRKTSQRVKWGQTRRMEQGVVFGGSLLGYDTAGGRLTVNQTGAQVVRRIFFQYLHERKGAAAIARELRRDGVLSSRGNLKWSGATVLKILKNEKYCGDLVQKKTYTPDFLTHEKKYNRGQEELVILRDHHEPIIDRETWEAVQQERRRRSRTGRDSGRGSRCLLSGKIKCGVCGSSFLARKKGERRIWRCGKAVQEGAGGRCDAQGAPIGCPVGRQLGEDTALELLRRALSDVKLDREEMAAHLSRVTAPIWREERESAHLLEMELEGLHQKKLRGLEAFLDQTISREEFCFLSRRWEARMAELEGRLLQLRQEGGGESALLAAIRTLTDGEVWDEEFCCGLLEHITVHADGRVVVALTQLPARWVFASEQRAKGPG